MNKYKISLFFLLLFFTFKSYSINFNENKILFKINNFSFTTIDYNNRINYLNLVNQDFKEDFIYVIEDYISVNLFNMYFINSNNKIDLNLEAEKIFNEINKNLNLSNLNNFNENLFYENIKLDLSRKFVIENILNERKNEIFQNNLDGLYKYLISYISVDKKNNLKINNINKKDDLKKFLDDNSINYFSKNKDVDDIDSLSLIIKKNIKKNKLNFKIDNKNFITYIFIRKQFKTFDGLVAKLYQYSTTEYLEKRNLNCNYITNLNTNLNDVQNKEYEYSKLNENIRDNLLQINDYLIFENNELINYVFLCDLKYNINIIKNISTNNKINSIAIEIERDFIHEYSSNYNLIRLYE